MRCEALADLLPALVDDPGALAPAHARHVGRCLRCQAEVARYRRLRRGLRDLASERVPVPAGLAGDLLAGLDEALSRPERHRPAVRRAAYLGGLAAATAAGVGGALVLVTRRRPA